MPFCQRLRPLGPAGASVGECRCGRRRRGARGTSPGLALDHRSDVLRPATVFLLGEKSENLCEILLMHAGPRDPVEPLDGKGLLALADQSFGNVRQHLRGHQLMIGHVDTGHSEPRHHGVFVLRKQIVAVAGKLHDPVAADAPVHEAFECPGHRELDLHSGQGEAHLPGSWPTPCTLRLGVLHARFVGDDADGSREVLAEVDQQREVGDRFQTQLRCDEATQPRFSLREEVGEPRRKLAADSGLQLARVVLVGQPQHRTVRGTIGVLERDLARPQGQHADGPVAEQHASRRLGAHSV
ncbi:hypothetical protein ABH927_005975 [Planotetraspora sp. GP83]